MTAYASGLHLIYKGFNYVSDIYGSFATSNEAGKNQFDGVLADNSSSVSLTMDFGIDAANNTVYDDDVKNTGFTETDANLATTITDAENAGLSVMIRPLIDFLPKDYNGDSNPKNGSYYNDEFRNYYNPGAAGSAGANSFFASYESMIVQEAKVAQANHAQIFDIGTELDQLTGPAYNSTANPYWNDIITAVKAVYSGQLTYSALWDDSQGYWKYSGNFTTAEQGSSYITGSLATQVSFWSQLDYVGIDEYAAISDSTDPDSLTVAQLEAGWTETPTDPVVSAVTGGKSLIQYYEDVAQQTGKPLLFTELGYPNASDAAETSATPGYDEDGNPDGAVADPQLQANLYQAFFDAWAAQGNSALAGVFIWEYEPNGGGTLVKAGTALYDSNGNEQYNPYVVQGYPGETQIADGFAECFCAGTRIATPAGEKPVETLREGDDVLTLHRGARRIRRITRSQYDGRFVKSNHLILPVQIRAHALAPNVPARDLRVSPGHGLYCQGVLVPAWRLVNGTTMTQAAVAGVIHYFHLELDSHEVLLAENCPAESYYDLAQALLAPLPRVENGALIREIQLRAGPKRSFARGRRLHGNVEQAGPERCVGWVRDLDDPEAPVWLDITSGGRRVSRVLANHFRADVRKAGYGSGCCGFDVALPAGLRGPVEVRGAAYGAIPGLLDALAA